MKTWSDLSKRQRVELLSFLFGGLLIITALYAYAGAADRYNPIAGSLFVAGVVVGLLPYGLFVYFRERKYEAMEKEFPSFLRNISESIKSGMSLPQAFQQATKTDYGKLDDEIERASHQLSWGVPFPEVINRMAARIEGSSLIQRSLYIILQSYESGGNISETLDAIAANASMIKEAEQEKKSVLMQQVYIIYAIHFLFVGILVAMYLLLSKFLLQMDMDAGGMMGLGSVDNFCQGTIADPLCMLCPAFGIGEAGEAICYYKSLFLIMITVEGVFNGIVAGEVLEGEASAGIKHSLIMAVIGLFLYIAALHML